MGKKFPYHHNNNPVIVDSITSRDMFKVRRTVSDNFGAGRARPGQGNVRTLFLLPAGLGRVGSYEMPGLARAKHFLEFFSEYVEFE